MRIAIALRKRSIRCGLPAMPDAVLLNVAIKAAVDIQQHHGGAHWLSEMKNKQTFVHGNIQRGAKTKLSKSSVTMHPVLASY